MGPAVLFVHSQKALKGKPPCGLAGDGQGRYQSAGAGYGADGNPRLPAAGHQLLPGVGDGGGARVGDQGAALPGLKPAQDSLSAGLGAVPVVGDHGLFKPQVVEQLHRHPGILGGDKVRLFQRIRHPPGDIPQVADGGGDQIQRTAQPRSPHRSE